MLSNDQLQPLLLRIRMSQLIAALLIVGAIVFIGLISFIADWENMNERAKMLNLFAGATGIFVLMLSLFVPKMFFAVPHLRPQKKSNGDSPNAPQPPVDPALVNEFSQSLMSENILRYALIDGAIFLNLVVFTIEPHISSFIVAGIGIALMILLFPRKAKMVASLQRLLV